MKKRTGVIITASSLALLFAGVVVAGAVAGADNRPASADKAKVAVDRFAKRNVRLERIEAVPQLEQAGIRKYKDADTGEEFTIDRRGVILGVIDDKVLKQFEKSQAGPSKPDAELIAAARAYASEHFSQMPVDKMVASLERRERGNDGTRAYTDVVVELRERVNGVPSCNFVSMVLDQQTGDVGMVIAEDGPVDISTKPAISKDDAVKIVADKAEMPVHKVDNAELVLWRSPEDEVLLVYRIVLKTGDAHMGATARALVDAHKGSLAMFGVSD